MYHIFIENRYKDRSLFVFLIVIIYNTILYYVINVNKGNNKITELRTIL